MKKLIGLVCSASLILSSFCMVPTEKIPSQRALIQFIKNDTTKNFSLTNPETNEKINILAGQTIRSFGIEIPTKYYETAIYYIRRGILNLENTNNPSEVYKIDFSIQYRRTMNSAKAYLALVKPSSGQDVEWVLAERVLDFTTNKNQQGQFFIEIILKADNLSETILDMTAGFRQ